MNKAVIGILMGVTLIISSCKKEDAPAKEAITIQDNVNVDEIQSNNGIPITSESVMEFDEESFDFKDIKKGEKVTHVFTFKNTGKKPLIISEVRPSCGCTTPDYTKGPVAPGKKGSITVTFDSTGFEGAIFKTVTVSGNFETKTIKFQAKIN